MSAEILLTVGALTAGWVVLSKKRAEASPTPGEVTTPEIAAVSTAPQDLGGGQMTTAVPDVPHFDIDDAAATGAADPSTEQSAPAPRIESFAYQAPTPTAPPKKPGSVTAGDTLRAGTTTVGTAKSIDPAALVYGDTSGITKRQESDALVRYGADLGLVW